MAEFNLATHQSATLKDLGNKLLREGKPEEAMVKYGEAIAAFEREGLHEGMAVCLVNRSIVNAKLSRWPESFCDAKLACSLFPRFFKARARREADAVASARSHPSRARSIDLPPGVVPLRRRARGARPAARRGPALLQDHRAERGDVQGGDARGPALPSQQH